MRPTDSVRARNQATQPGVAGRLMLPAVLVLITISAVIGCEVNSFLDPSRVGYFESTPKTLPILGRLDVIDEPELSSLPVTQVQPSDLLPDKTEYVIGPGDVVTFTVFELIVPGADTVQTRRVDETGRVRLPVIGSVQAADKSPSKLEQEIIDLLDRENILTDATVSVVVQESRQNTYSVIGEPFSGSTAFGTYVIPKPDFRLLEALALARGAPDRTKRIMVFRQAPLVEEAATGAAPEPGAEQVKPAEESPANILEELEGALEGEAPTNGERKEPTRAPAPKALEGGLDSGESPAPWVKVGDQWVRATDAEAAAAEAQDQALAEALGQVITQRIIEVPYDRLLNGDMRYNIVVRAGDVIRVPAPSGGFVYLMGDISRPGAYTVPGERDLTLKQLIASGGGLGPTGIPGRVDLIRRIGDNHEAMVRLNLRAIFHGDEPDIFLKPNDQVNIGTNFVATPIAIFRNGFRATYGFGFILDKNFSSEVFGN